MANGAGAPPSLTKQALDAGLRLDDPAARALFCATAQGESRVRACVGSICLDGTIAAFSGALTAFEIVPSPVTATANPLVTGEPRQSVCVPVRVNLVFDNGFRYDVTASPITEYTASLTNGFGLEQIRDAFGIPRTSAGDPCFTLPREQSCPTATAIDFPVFVSYRVALPPGSRGASANLNVHVAGISRPAFCR